MPLTQHRQLGAHGPEVSAIGLGFMSFGRSVDDNELRISSELVAEAIDQGITLFDTADVYGPEHSEILLGRALAGKRDKVVLATKFANALDRTTNPDARAIDGRPEYIRTAIDASLKRLGTDYVDLYYQHRVDPTVPIEDTVGALAELVTAGKIRFIGLSEPGPGTLRRAHAVHPISAVQNEWSIFTRDIEDKTLPVARELGIGVVPFSPLGRGWLTGTVTTTSDVDERRGAHPRFGTENFDTNLALAGEVTALAGELGVRPGQVALAWLLAQGDDVVPIPGTRHIEYLRENVGGVDLVLDSAHRERLATIAAQVAGHRSIRPEHLGIEAPEPATT